MAQVLAGTAEAEEASPDLCRVPTLSAAVGGVWPVRIGRGPISQQGKPGVVSAAEGDEVMGKTFEVGRQCDECPFCFEDRANTDDTADYWCAAAKHWIAESLFGKDATLPASRPDWCPLPVTVWVK